MWLCLFLCLIPQLCWLFGTLSPLSWGHPELWRYLPGLTGVLGALAAVLGAKAGTVGRTTQCSPASWCSAALGDSGLGNKRLISFLSLPVRQDLKIQLEWEPLIAALLACCSHPALALHGNQMKAMQGGWGEEGMGKGGSLAGRKRQEMHI